MGQLVFLRCPKWSAITCSVKANCSSSQRVQKGCNGSQATRTSKLSMPVSSNNSMPSTPKSKASLWKSPDLTLPKKPLRDFPENTRRPLRRFWGSTAKFVQTSSSTEREDHAKATNSSWSITITSTPMTPGSTSSTSNWPPTSTTLSNSSSSSPSRTNRQQGTSPHSSTRPPTETLQDRAAFESCSRSWTRNIWNIGLFLQIFFKKRQWALILWSGPSTKEMQRTHICRTSCWSFLPRWRSCMGDSEPWSDSTWPSD